MRKIDTTMVPFPVAGPKHKAAGLTITPLAVGVVCHLRSGSPKMTVTALLENDVIEVTWCKFEEAEMQVWKLPLAAIRIDG